MKKDLNSIFYWAIIIGLLLGCIMLFMSGVEHAKPSTSYKYKIYTQSAIYFTNEIECDGNGKVRFRNSNGEYIEIR